MSAAVLFYGYNLGTPDENWAITNSEDFEPDWMAQAETDMEGEHDGEDYTHHMRRAILLGCGLESEEISRDNAQALLKEQYLEVITFGHTNTRYYGLALTGSVYEADDWSPSLIKPDFEWNANLRIPGVDIPDSGCLAVGLRCLAMEPVQEHGSWILAPDEY